MKVQIYAVLFALSTLSVGALGQCAKPEMNPIWDTDKQQFRCVATAGSEVSSHDETVSPKGDKVFCNNARENLMKACPGPTRVRPARAKQSPFSMLVTKILKLKARVRLDQRA
jgi:hypothetical protein